MHKSKSPSEKSARTVVGVRVTDEEMRRIDACVASATVGSTPVNVSRSEMMHACMLRGLELLEQEQRPRPGK
jgi:hypothetical protein